MVYSIVNITDRSWGTREGTVKSNKVNTDQMAWYHQLWFKFREVFFCCFKDERDKLMGMKDGGDTDKKEVKEEETEKDTIKETKEERLVKVNIFIAFSYLT